MYRTLPHAAAAAADDDDNLPDVGNRVVERRRRRSGPDLVPWPSSSLVKTTAPRHGPELNKTNYDDVMRLRRLTSPTASVVHCHCAQSDVVT